MCFNLPCLLYILEPGFWSQLRPAPAPQELLNLNVVKGATEVVGSQELMGRAMIAIGKFNEAPGQLFDDWCGFQCFPCAAALSCCETVTRPGVSEV